MNTNTRHAIRLFSLSPLGERAGVRGFADCSRDLHFSPPHDFNMDAVIANHFGHGDDHSPPNLTHGPGLLPDSDRSQPHTSS